MIAMLFRKLYPWIPSFIKRMLVLSKMRRINRESEYTRRITIPFHNGDSSYPPYERRREY